MKKITTLILGLIISTTSYAQLISESFDDITTLSGDGWSQINVSTVLPGGTDWYQGNDAVFPSNSGATTAYIAANFNNTGDGAGLETISNWLITPVVTVQNGDAITFYTRTTTASTFPDRLQVRLSDTGASSTDPTTDTDVGSYTNLLLDINPTLVTGVFPDVWTQQVINVSGLSGATDVRIAFRYFVTDGGPTGANSDYIGIDDVVVTSTLSTNDFEKNQLSHFYNKSSGRLLLESSDLTLNSIEIFNNLGQNVFSKSLSNFKEEVSLLSLSDGVYIAKVKVGDGEKTIKLLKQ
ncbi:MAG: choice-of-anchor J domain-containing protein [Flavobacteriaceae bacterium]|nr:T9SS type A sorting domain-containing protein [Flavobacteriaceae bacterium]